MGELTVLAVRLCNFIILNNLHSSNGEENYWIVNLCSINYTHRISAILVDFTNQ